MLVASSRELSATRRHPHALALMIGQGGAFSIGHFLSVLCGRAERTIVTCAICTRRGLWQHPRSAITSGVRRR